LVGLFIVVLSFFLPSRRTTESRQDTEQWEETLEVFLNELEEDNEKLLETISNLKREQVQMLDKLSARIDELDSRVREQERELRQVALARLEQQASFSTAPASDLIGNEVIPPQDNRNAPEPSISNGKLEASEAPVSDPSPEHRTPVVESAPQALSVKARYPELFRLYNEGKSVDSIAKRLGMNNGEVSLILRLAKQEGN